jgi:acyl-CoA oxidase
MAEYLVDDVSPYFLHMEMFITTIREQASEFVCVFHLA